MKKFIIILSSLLLFLSCEKEIDISIDITQPKLVVNGLFFSDSLWKLEISSSKYIYDTGAILLVNDALVTILDSKGNNYTLTNAGKGIYSSLSKKPELGESYTINVSHDNYENVSATSKMPDKIQIEKVEEKDITITSGTQYRKVAVTFNDNQENDFYSISVNSVYLSIENDELTGKTDTVEISSPIELYSQDPTLGEFSETSYGSKIVFSDDIFNGKSYTFEFLIDENYLTLNGETDNSGPDLNQIKLFMSRITEEYYFYETSYEEYNLNNDNYFSQPVQVYTNIENGLGIFAGYSVTVDSLVLK